MGGSLFKNRYRVETVRLPSWDYSAPGYYYITMCTKNRGCYLGREEAGQIILSSAGDIATEEWLKAPMVRPDVRLDEFVVMPNHLHGIAILRQTSLETHLRGVSTARRVPRTTLGSLIRQFKSITTKRIWASGNREFGWQTRFHDHIIRSERSLNAIRNYILDNPRKWAEDRYHPTRGNGTP
ncbi:MAG: transposase [Chloroflexi bacterium]|nr:MAG: transposase [Chloroflexota bacterium]